MLLVSGDDSLPECKKQRLCNSKRAVVMVTVTTSSACSPKCSYSILIQYHFFSC